MAQLAQLVDDVVVNRFELKNKELTLGRHPANEVQIDEDAVSGRHAVIKCESNKDFANFKEFYVEDLNSTNGTFVNEKKIKGRVRLHHNDVIRLAWNKFKFIDDTEAQADKTAVMIKGGDSTLR
jgi:pSer/pThr/pTyr-binding forkhead associated (FHA) protein